MRRRPATELSADRAVALDAREAELTAELHALVVESNDVRRQLRTVRRTLDRIAEERQAHAIDRLLGLA